MLHGLQDRDEWRDKSLIERGLTLVELLVVIVIIGILVAVAVFAVGGVTDRGKASACKTDKRILQTAAEASYAKNGTYPASEAALVAGGFLKIQSTLYNYSASDGSFAITVQDRACTGT